MRAAKALLLIAFFLAGCALPFVARWALADTLTLVAPPTPGCVVPPAPDSLLGTVGSGQPCVYPPDASRPSAVQAAVATTDATGGWSVTWARSFSGTTPFVQAQPINALDAQPFICNITTSTATQVTGRCWKTMAATLPVVAASLLGLVVNPTASSGVIQVRVAGRDLTQ